MNKRKWIVVLSILVLVLVLTASTTINGARTILGIFDASGASHTLSFKVVANTGALPATGCTPGEMAVVTAATLGQQIYQNSGSGACSWTQQLNSGTATGGGISVYSAVGLTVTANTYYFPIGGGGTPSTTETNVDVDSPSAATATNFYAQLSVALGIGNTGVFTMRKNATSQSVTCTISGAVATSCSDTTHSFAVSQGDLLTVQFVTTGTILVTPNVMFAFQFGNITATGTVNSGTVNQTAYYAAAGTAVSGAGPGTTGQVYTSNGPGSPPSFQSASGGLTLIQQHTASGASSIDFPSTDTPPCISATYDQYQIELSGLVPAGGSPNVVLLFSTNGGSSFLTTNYGWGQIFSDSSGASATGSSGGVTAGTNIRLNENFASTTAANGGVSGHFVLFTPAIAAGHQVTFESSNINGSDGHLWQTRGSGWNSGTTAVNAFRIQYVDTGGAPFNITGTVRCYGLAK